MKNDVIVKDTFGVFFKSKWYDTNCFEKLEGGYIHVHEENWKINLFWNVRGRLEV